MIRFENVTKRYRGTTRPALNAVDFEVQRGEFVFLVGASGSGKSSCLQLILRAETPSEGRVVVLGRDLRTLSNRKVPYFRRHIGSVFQDFRLLPNKTVHQNVAFTLQVTGASRGFIQQAVPEVLALVGLDGKEKRLPHELSGGEQQRVAIARALVRTPSVFLFDEPLSNLDAKLRVELRSEIRRLQQELGITALYVTHDQEEAMTIADQLVVLHAGRIEQRGTPEELYRTPVNPFVAGFIGSPTANLVDGRIRAGVFEAGDVRLVLGTADHAAVTAGIRPEDLLVAPAPDGSGRVGLVELLGPRYVFIVEVGALRLTAVVETATVAGWGGPPQPGDRVSVSVRPGRAHVFDTSSGSRLSA